MQFVEGDVDDTALGYTVGLTELNHPEIVVTGRTMEETYIILRELALMVLDHGHVLDPGMELDLHSRPVFLAPMMEPAKVLLTARDLYGPSLSAVQAVWVDDEGRFPWQQAVPDVLTQPIYGMFTV
ncbi:DUF4262 domain-containing protein [Arthrobacter monumenti]